MLEPTVTSTQLDGVAIVSLHGEHDVSTSDTLQRVLQDHLTGAGSRIVVDLTDATFIDSTTLNAILRSRTQADGVGVAVTLVAPVGGQPRSVLDTVHAGDFVRVFPIRELAIDALTVRPTRFIATARYGPAAR